MEAKTKSDKKYVILPVKGMTCASCVEHVEGALKEVSGVTLAQVNLAMEQASVEYDPSKASLEDMQKAVKDVGYEIAEDSVRLPRDPIICAKRLSAQGQHTQAPQGEYHKKIV